MDIILFLTRHIYYHAHYLFISFIPNLHYSSRSHYFDPIFFFNFFVLFFYGDLHKQYKKILFIFPFDPYILIFFL